MKTHIRWERINDPPYKWQAINSYRYYNERFNRYLTVTQGDKSDGATDAFDIFSDGWGVHDQACKTGKWDDGTRITNWQASWVLSDILWGESRQLYAIWKDSRKYKDLWRARWRRLQAVYWWPFTFLFGGGKARENGMFRLKK